MTEEELREVERTAERGLPGSFEDVPRLTAEIRRLMASALASAEQDRREVRAEIERLTKIAAAERALRMAEHDRRGNESSFYAVAEACDALRALGVVP